jgi:RHS repeat-associated protein
VYDATGRKWQVREFTASDSLVGSYSHLGSFEFERNTLNLVRHPSGFIKNLQSIEYQTGRQNGNIQGANIVSTQKITAGKYEAENQITLLPGFEATAHDQFSAEIKPQSPQYQWQYALTDHLGNLRVLFADKNGDGLIRQDTNSGVNEILSIRNYSPFGLELGGSHKNLDYQNPYRFGGKEHSNFTGYSDFGGRWYDSNRSGWNQVDPLAEKYYAWSQYNYTFNNPIRLIDPTGMGPEDPLTHTIKKGETLTSISKQYGVSVQDLAILNGLQNADKIRAGTTLKVNPEMDFSNNPHGGYQNPNNSTGEVVSMNNIANVGVGFVVGAGSENVVVAGGKALESVQKWDKVKYLVSEGTTALTADGKLSKGETFTGSYSPGSLMSYLGRALKGEEKLVSPVHIVGSFGFSMRVNADGNTATIAVYDSKTNSSFSDHKLGTSSDRTRDPSKSGNQPLTTQYFRFIWIQSLK